MKHWICSLLLLYSIGGFAQTERNPLIQDFVRLLKGKVKHVVELSDTNGSVDIYRNDIFRRELHLTEEGLCTVSAMYRRQGDTISDKIGYNTRDKKIWFKRRVNGEDHAYTETGKYRYDAQDNLTEVSIVSPHHYKQITKYNAAGDKTEDHRIPLRSAQGDFSDSRFLQKYVNEYSNGQLKKITTFRGGDTSGYSYLYTYDSNGQLIKLQSISIARLVSKIETYAYDTAGNVIDYINSDDHGDIQVHYSWQYDTGGNRTTFTEYDPQGKVKSYIVMKYQYDAAGNWTERRYELNGKEVGLITRQFVYY